MSITTPSPVGRENEFEVFSGELSDSTATDLFDHKRDYKTGQDSFKNKPKKISCIGNCRAGDIRKSGRCPLGPLNAIGRQLNSQVRMSANLIVATSFDSD